MNIWLIKALKWIHFTTRVKRSALNKNYNQPHNILSARRTWQSCPSGPVNDPNGPQLMSLDEDEDDDGETIQAPYFLLSALTIAMLSLLLYILSAI